jgi:AraC-like DNA-binding protein
MPSSAVRTFADADQYAAAIRAAAVEMTLTGRGEFAAKLTRVDFHRLWMQRFSDNLPHVVHAGLIPGRAFFTFRTQPGPRMLWSGVAVETKHVTRHTEVDSIYQVSFGAASIGAMSLPLEDIATIGATMAECDLTPPRNTLTIAAPRRAMAKLQRLHAAAGQLAEDAPEIIANPSSARGLEQALIEAAVGCLRQGDPRENTFAQRQHSLIMRRFRKLLEENPTEPLYIPEICKAIGASDRTLRVCCHEQFGIGPKRYLLLRHLHLARRALREAPPHTTTVTDIATRFGFWQFGRFAGEYRALFGESPSVTLHRPPG